MSPIHSVENQSYFPSPPREVDLGILLDVEVEVILAEDPWTPWTTPTRDLSAPPAPPEEVAVCMIGLLGHFDHDFFTWIFWTWPELLNSAGQRWTAWTVHLESTPFDTKHYDDDILRSKTWGVLVIGWSSLNTTIETYLIDA